MTIKRERERERERERGNEVMRKWKKTDSVMREEKLLTRESVCVRERGGRERKSEG